MSLPAGRGQELAQAMDSFIKDVREGVPALFDSEENQNRLRAIEEEFRAKPEEAFEVRQPVRKKFPKRRAINIPDLARRGRDSRASRVLSHRAWTSTPTGSSRSRSPTFSSTVDPMSAQR